ncbi:C2H2-type zinc finger protein [Phanerochaete sordida]|uniref:C2H2-type zinc finger protein n=1 Tax=Phanerochaete sordida TaxID=48140 RepID=A0A9P3GLJ6_9APHY|nr:C2H2-type zinc finger protein [Phanerochaete sordida]
MVGDADHPSESLPSIREVFPDQFPPSSAQAGATEDPQGGAQAPEAPAAAQDDAYAKRKYVCETCQKRFLRPSSLKAHTVVHTGDRPYACPFPGCTKRFTSKSNMKRHHQTHGGAAPEPEPVAGSSTGPGTLAAGAPATAASQAGGSSSAGSSSAGHFGVLNLGQQHPPRPPPPQPPGPAGQR